MQRFQIDPQDWSELSRLLDTALELPAAEREAWLESLDAHHAPLRSHLRNLLACAVRIETRDFLNTLPKLDGAPELASPSDREGASIGPYRLIRELGAGGMGSVWLAERTDGLVNRPVALKLPHVASHRVGLAERMAREREILATLAHPNIARLYDAGVTSEGRPYLALEYIDGTPINRYCDEHRLEVRARLRLFVQVANAVAYAHAKLIVHRDLKPGNILVMSEGEVRLLDFGVAKLLENGAVRHTRLTELSGRALTPDYASPEQILGEPITIGADVYALGVILYELLTGERPYRLKRDSRGALEDAIVQTDPVRPSDIVSNREAKALRGDLDTIVLKALKKKPEERYATVNAFVDDIYRHLSSRPVLAQPDSPWYRMQKFVRRNRVVVVAGSTVALAIASGAGLALWQALEATRQRDLALQEQRRAEAVKNLMVSIFKDADPNASGGKPLTAVELVRQASRALADEPIADPIVRAEVSYVLSSSLVRLRDIDSAEQVARAALADATARFAPDHIQVARARLAMAEVLRFRGNLQEMRILLEQILPQLRTQQDTAGSEYLLALKAYGNLEIDASKYDDAIVWAEQAVAASERLFGGASNEAIDAHMLLALSHTYAKHTDEALAAAEEAHRRARAAHGANSRHPLVIDTSSSYARALDLAGQLDRSIELQETALAAVEVVWGKDSVKVGFHSQVLAATQLRAGKLAAARQSGERAVRILADTFAPASFSNVAMWSVYARALLFSRRGIEALAATEKVPANAAQVFGASSPNTFDERANHALALALTGSVERAAQQADAVLADALAAGGPKSHRPAHISGRIARLKGEPRRAQELQLAALTVESTLAQAWERAAVVAELGLTRLELGELESSAQNLKEALQLLDRARHSATPVRADVQVGLARIALQRGETDGALGRAQQADEFWRQFDAESRWAGEAALWLGRCYLALGRRTEADEALERAATILERSAIPTDRELVNLARRRDLAQGSEERMRAPSTL